MTYKSSSLKKIGSTYGLQKELIIKQTDQNEVFEGTWMKNKMSGQIM